MHEHANALYAKSYSSKLQLFIMYTVFKQYSPFKNCVSYNGVLGPVKLQKKKKKFQG